jgi:hypothetical protein
MKLRSSLDTKLKSPATAKPLKPIGGFFDLEIPPAMQLHHRDAIALNTGRACLMVCLSHLKPRRAFVPHYTCDATLEPFNLLNIEIEFYNLDSRFEPSEILDIQHDECFLITNYWGLQRDLMERLSVQFGDRLIIDNTHDFYWNDTPSRSWSFTSARKWFGVPDGAFLNIPSNIDSRDLVSDRLPTNQAISLQHAVNRSNGQLKLAFEQYQDYERSLDCDPLLISEFSKSILSHVDMNSGAEIRRKNFRFLDRHLSSRNQLRALTSQDLTPFVYPFLTKRPIDRTKFHSRDIFVPQLWRDVLKRDNCSCLNSEIWSRDLLPLPVDQRYGVEEMKRIVNVIDEVQSNDG